MSAIQAPNLGMSVAKEVETMRGDSQQVELRDMEKGLCSPEKSNSSTASAGVFKTPTNPLASRSDPYGNEEGAAIQYRTMHWLHVGLLMLAEIISLGVLALPFTVSELGMLPGLTLICFLGIVATYTGYVIGQFKLRYPHVTSFADAGEMVAGAFGRELMAVSAELILIFIMAAHILSFSICLNALTGHAVCTVVFGFAGFAVCLVLTLPRTYKNIAYFSFFSCVSIVSAVVTTMICIAIVKPDVNHVVAVNSDLPLVRGISAVLVMVLAYAGHVAFFGFHGEMRRPTDFPKALVFMMAGSCVFYMVISAVIYFYGGPDVASPALGSATPVVKKVVWALALPTVVVAGVVNASVACKYVYMRFWQGTDVIHQKSFKALGSWVFICAVTWLLAWLIAEAIPNFNTMIAFIGALFGSWFSYGLPGGLWLYMNKGVYFATPKKAILTVVNVGVLCLGATMCTLGLYASIVQMKNGEAKGSFSCANNDETTR